MRPWWLLPFDGLTGCRCAGTLVLFGCAVREQLHWLALLWLSDGALIFVLATVVEHYKDVQETCPCTRAGSWGESKRPVVESPCRQFASECQRFWHPPRLDK